MALTESISRLTATILSILQNRLELASIEFQEELLHVFSSLLWSLVALFCLGVAVSILVLLLIITFWDTHRIGVLLTLALTFAVSGILIGLGVRNRHRKQPRLLSHTLNEINQDLDALGAAHSLAPTPPSSASSAAPV
jgi:uncharacterized membrane protein YqjE